jgi:hypothetical protein
MTGVTVVGGFATYILADLSMNVPALDPQGTVLILRERTSRLTG